MLSAWEEFYRSCFSTFKMKRIDLSKNRWHWIKGKKYECTYSQIYLSSGEKDERRREKKKKTAFKWKNKIILTYFIFKSIKDLFIRLLIHNLTSFFRRRLFPSLVKLFLFSWHSSSFSYRQFFFIYRLFPPSQVVKTKH